MDMPLSQQSTRAFGRIRSSLEQSLRTATRSKKAQSPPAGEFSTVVSPHNGKDKVTLAVPKEKAGMLRRLESKVTFRRAGRETPSPLPPVPVEKAIDEVRLAGFTRFVTPSMRQGSMSSPSLHLASSALPSPKSRPSIPISSSSNSEIHATPTREQSRELIRTSSSMLCKEIIKIPSHMSKSDSGVKEWEEVEIRTRALARAERIWGKSGDNAGGSSSNLASPGGSGASASAEERERRLFTDALRDGYVLCQFMNKLRSASIVKPDTRDDGVLRTSNITKFLAACSSYGLPEEDVFLHDDLIEATGESLARVARTIIALVKFVDTPVVEKSRIIHGQGRRPDPISMPGPYQPGGSSSRASASTPNLFHPSISTSPTKKRHSPPIPIQSENPDRTIRGVPSVESKKNPAKGAASEKQNRNVPAMPPLKSPLRAKPKRIEETELSAWAKAATSPSGGSWVDSVQAPLWDAFVDEPYDPRQSVVSSAITETTVTTDISSILDFGHSSSGNNKYGTIRTVTTDMTSEAPSMTRTEGNAIAEELTRRKSTDSGTRHPRDRKLSEAPVVDLSRVIEEGDDSASTSSRGNGRLMEHPKAMTKSEKPPALHLHKGKWPDDFMDAFQTHSPVLAVTPKSSIADQEDNPKRTPISISPPRKLAVVGASRRNESAEALPQFPRRPTHRARQSVDAPVLMPKETILGRDNSPDGMTSGSSGARVILRRHSTKPDVPGPQKNTVHFTPRNAGSYVPDTDPRVPFPRTTSVEHSGSPSPVNLPSSNEEIPRIPRGRFQSDINDSSSRRRARPNSHDELGVKPMRSRIESMVNLGADSANASASDLLLSRDSDGSAVRKTLVLREDGKPATHFQLGNCIGRGQFGSVYRALNLNTGQMVAVKRIRLNGLKESEIETLMREVDLVKSLSHPSIVKYEGMARDADTLSIVLEYAENGSLGQTLKAFGKLNERLVASYVVKILEGLHYLHQSDVVHCDLKAANILTTKNGNVKLSDFGVSLNLRAMEREIKDVAGTPNWMAPEVIELKGASTKSDIWSLACTVIELLTGRPPYADIANSMTVMYSIVEDDMPPLPPSCSPLLRDFLTICFNKDPSRRPSAMMLFEHPWLKQNWGIYKELRPQDSIPFLRRVSADLQKSEFVRYLSQLDSPELPITESSVRDDVGDKVLPPGRRISNVSVRPPGPLVDSDISPREHQFVKTTFSKPMVCRVCLLNVKKSAVLCAQCSLIAHSKCAVNAPPTCDLRSQLLLYAKYAEQGHSASVYSNPADGLRDIIKSPASDVPYVAHSPRTSLDASSPPPQTHIPSYPVHPPTAYKFMGFKRSRQSLSPEPNLPATSSSVPSASLTQIKDEKLLRKKGVSSKHDRPHSLSSNSTDVSMWSAPTSYKGTRSSGHSNGIKSSPLIIQSDTVTDNPEIHTTGTIPGALPTPETTRRYKQREKPSGCSVQ
ncbi:hypothetical protein H0H87_012600 [Tephrocybe sp. NHM501043]|nr:hypothetical protein H0H87_012600 [Tephrocybe sp. NHM501043]